MVVVVPEFSNASPVGLLRTPPPGTLPSPASADRRFAAAAPSPSPARRPHHGAGSSTRHDRVERPDQNHNEKDR